MAVTTNDIITTAISTHPRGLQRWPYGPRCLPSEHKAYTVPLATYLSWIEDVERSMPGNEAWARTRQAAQRVRMVAYSVTTAKSAGALFDQVLDTEAEWLAEPLGGIGYRELATVEGVYRTNAIRVRPELPAVDMSHLWVLFDRALNGFSMRGHGFDSVISAEGVLSWVGDLASWWTEYNDEKQKARRAALQAGEPWSEPIEPEPLARPIGWLEAKTQTRCAVDDLFGDMDAIVLSAALADLDVTASTPLADLLRSYYEAPAPADFRALHVRNRFHHFVRLADPAIPHTLDAATGRVRLAPDAKLAIRRHVRDGITWLLRVSRLKGYHKAFAEPVPWDQPIPAMLAASSTTNPLAVHLSVEQDLDSPWGAAILDLVATRFTTFLLAGLDGADGWTTSGWAEQPNPSANWGGYQLQIGDSDAAARWGGVVRGGSGNHVRQLQQDLAALGFAIVGTPDGGFGNGTAMALREFQIEASNQRVLRHLPPPSGGIAVEPATRRYHGVINGVLDEATADILNLWLRPPGGGRIVCPLRIEARRADGTVKNANVWRYNEETESSATDADNLYFFAIDAIDRYPIPPQDAIPGQPGVTKIGRYFDKYGGGPYLPKGQSWESAKITPHRLLPPGLSITTPDVASKYRVICAVAHVECQDYFDGYNAYDLGRVSVGVYHWILHRSGVGELAALLAIYKDMDPEGYHVDFGRLGIEPEKPWDPATWNGDGAHALANVGGRIAMYGLRDGAGAVHPFTLRPLGTEPGDDTDDPIIDQYIPDNFLRNWHALHRWCMTMRTSLGIQRAQWPLALLRLQNLMPRVWRQDNTPADGPVVPDGAGGFRVARFGEIFTSERAVAGLLRFHVNRPGWWMNERGAKLARSVHMAYEDAYGTGRVDLTSFAPEEATRRQQLLAQALINRALIGKDGGESAEHADFQSTVRNAINYNDPVVGKLNATAGSFLGP